MKKILKSLLPALVLVFFACENDTQELEIENKKQETTLVNKGGSPEEQELARMQNIMQWTSFLTAEVLQNNAQAKAEFITELISIPGSSAKRINMFSLFSNSNPHFTAAFQQIHYTYENNLWVHWVEECGRPRGGAPLPDPSGSTSTHQAFVNTLLNRCLEIYLPLGFDANVDTITSSAHPLSTAFINDCFVHPGCEDGLTISPFSLASYDNPIIVRPYLDVKDLCSYNQFGIDFTDFLNN